MTECDCCLVEVSLAFVMEFGRLRMRLLFGWKSSVTCQVTITNRYSRSHPPPTPPPPPSTHPLSLSVHPVHPIHRSPPLPIHPHTLHPDLPHPHNIERIPTNQHHPPLLPALHAQAFQQISIRGGVGFKPPAHLVGVCIDADAMQGYRGQFRQNWVCVVSADDGGDGVVAEAVQERGDVGEQGELRVNPQ